MRYPRAILAILYTLALAVSVCVPAAARPLAAAHATSPVPPDRWLEIDLYWFDSADISGSAATFWHRYAPLYRDVAGYKGVVLDVGLTVDYIATFSGNLDQPIALPRG